MELEILASDFFILCFFSVFSSQVFSPFWGIDFMQCSLDEMLCPSMGRFNSIDALADHT